IGAIDGDHRGDGRQVTRMQVMAGVLLAATASQGAEFRVSDYGAKGDGKSIDTVAIQKTIDAAAKAGGTIVLKAGVYLTGSLFLKSGTTRSEEHTPELQSLTHPASRP